MVRREIGDTKWGHDNRVLLRMPKDSAMLEIVRVLNLLCAMNLLSVIYYCEPLRRHHFSLAFAGILFLEEERTA